MPVVDIFALWKIVWGYLEAGSLVPKLTMFVDLQLLIQADSAKTSHLTIDQFCILCEVVSKKKKILYVWQLDTFIGFWVK